MRLHILLLLLIGINLAQGIPEILLRGTETHLSRRIWSSLWPFASSPRVNKDEGTLDFTFPHIGQEIWVKSIGPSHRIHVTAMLYREIEIFEDKAGYIKVEIGTNYRLEKMLDDWYFEINSRNAERVVYLYLLNRYLTKEKPSHVHTISRLEARDLFYDKTVKWTVDFALRNPEDYPLRRPEDEYIDSA